jgi:hypothetical protein
MKTRIALFLLILALGVTRSATAQITNDVVATGGGTAGNGSICLKSTIGQSVVGTVVADKGAASQGFWSAIRKQDRAQSDASTSTAGTSNEIVCTPNPFSTSVEISMTVQQAGPVVLTLHDVHGKIVRTLIDAPKQAGAMTFRLDADDLPSGTYFVTMTAGETYTYATLQLIR